MATERRTDFGAMRIALAAAWLTAPIFATACGDDDSKPGSGDVRDASARPLPERVTPDGSRRDASSGSDLVDDFLGPFDAGLCCTVDFALAAKAGEIAAVLRGTNPPLNSPTGMPLRYVDGAWKVSVCMPSAYAGLYYYEAYSLPDTDGDGGVVEATEMPESGSEPLGPEVLASSGLFRTVRHNGAVLTEADPLLGVVNIFRPTDACGETADSGRHGQVGAPSSDAGSVDSDAGS